MKARPYHLNQLARNHYISLFTYSLISLIKSWDPPPPISMLRKWLENPHGTLFGHFLAGLEPNAKQQHLYSGAEWSMVMTFLLNPFGMKIFPAQTLNYSLFGSVVQGIYPCCLVWYSPYCNVVWLDVSCVDGKIRTWAWLVCSFPKSIKPWGRFSHHAGLF